MMRASLYVALLLSFCSVSFAADKLVGTQKCESQNYKVVKCTTAKSFTILKVNEQLSSIKCVIGSTAKRLSDHEIEVSKGCRAIFGLYVSAPLPTPTPAPTPTPRPTATPAPTPTPPQGSFLDRGTEGPPWPSGVRANADTSAEFQKFENLTGVKKLDVCAYFGANASDWNGIANQIKSDSNPVFNRPECRAYLVAIRTLPSDTNLNVNGPLGCNAFKEIADKKYDAYFNTLGSKLKSSLTKQGLDSSKLVLRVGWEMNLNSWPWFIGRCDTPAKVEFYKSAHRHIVDILRSYLPKVKISWNFAKESTKLPLPPKAYLPDANSKSYVDAVSLDYYDYWLAASSLAEFRTSSRAYKGSPDWPQGIRAWADFAKSNGKKFGVDEWGLLDGDSAHQGGGDNPAYIEGMYDFFWEYQSDIAYEVYFNRKTDNFEHRITDGVHPDGSYAYKTRWK